MPILQKSVPSRDAGVARVGTSLTTKPPIECTTNIIGRCRSVSSERPSLDTGRTCPIPKSLSDGDSSSWAYLRSYKRSLAKSRIDHRFFPLPGRKFALYPNVDMRAVLMSCSCGRNFIGQKYSISRSFDHVLMLLPPSPWTNTTSARGLPCGRWTTCRPS
jgi:hypothetical protein